MTWQDLVALLAVAAAAGYLARAAMRRVNRPARDNDCGGCAACPESGKPSSRLIQLEGKKGQKV